MTDLLSELFVLAVVIIGLFVLVGKGNLVRVFARVLLRVTMYRAARLVLRAVTHWR